ncbi:autotransporter outer membrane beta-barrel domain-containing protein [Martelella sp. HB161492]|uniref:autotransporter outer membrane beta-barrel domain-containing protein n=1 Tax=Martelella sp. HB161492 TaxID=2720726 RepID=UPI001FF04DF0|nr:autotransporter outer membrane beta-barrel domain-containing protein [Martelella sp. HB161492]
MIHRKTRGVTVRDCEKPLQQPEKAKVRFVASSILFQSTALLGTLAGVPLPFYSRGYSRAYAQSSCTPSSVTTETGSNIDTDQFNQRNSDIAVETITCTIDSGSLTTSQYAYAGSYMAVIRPGEGGGNSDTYRGHIYSVHSNWGWTGLGLSITNDADIAVTEASSTELLMQPGDGISVSDLKIAKTQSAGLSAVSLGALNWSGSDDMMETGAGNGGTVKIVSSGDVSSTVGGGILALSKGGTAKHAHDTGKSYGGSAGSVVVRSTGVVSGTTFGIAALSIGGPSTYSSHDDLSGSGIGHLASVYVAQSVYATTSGPAIIAASYGGNTPYNTNQFGDDVSGGDGGGAWNGDFTDPVAVITLGSSSNAMTGTISTQSAGAVRFSTANGSVQLTRETGAALLAIARGGDGLSRGGKLAPWGGLAGPAKIDVYGASSTRILTYGDNSPAVHAVSQGGTSYQSGKKDNEQPGGYSYGASVSITGGGQIQTSGAYSSGIIVQSLGGGGTSTYKHSKGIGGAAMAVTVTNDFAITTKGAHSHGIIAQSASAVAGGGILIYASDNAMTLGDTSSDGSTSGDVTVTNSGVIKVYGVDSHGIVAQSIGGGGGALSSTATLATTSYSTGEAVSGTSGGQTIGGQSSGSVAATVTVTNKGAIFTYGGYASASTAAASSDSTDLGGGIAILAQSIGGGGGTNDGGGASGSIGAGTGGSSDGAGSDGGHVYIHNYANLTTVGSEAHGIVAQSVGGGGGQGRNKKGLFHTVGGAGGPGGAGGHVFVRLEAGVVIQTKGDYASGVIAQSVGGGGGVGGQATAWGIGISSATGGKGGAGGNGGNAQVTQFGSTSQIITSGYHATAILVQSIGGGGGVGGNAKSTSASVGLGISIAHGGGGGQGGYGAEALAYINGTVATSGIDADAIVLQSIGGGGGNGGQASAKAITAGVPIDEEGNTISLSVSVAHGGSGGDGGDGDVALTHVYETAVVDTKGDGAAGLVVQSIGAGGGNGGDSTASSVARSITSWLAEGEEDVGEGADFAVSVDVALGGKGGTAGDGDFAAAYISGLVQTSGDYADGLVVQSIGGGGGNAGTGSGSTKASKGIKTAALNISMGADGGAGGYGGTVNVGLDATAAKVTTAGHVSRGIFAQSIGGGGGASSGSGGMGDADWALTIGLGAKGSDGGDGGAVNVWSNGTIITSGDWSDAILAQSIGGGGGAAGSGKSSLSIKQDEDDDDDDGGDDAESAATATATSDDDDDDDSDSTLTFNATIGTSGGSGGNGGTITIGRDIANSNAIVGTGSIRTYGTMSSGIVAQSIGGGGGAVAVSSGSDDSDDADTGSSASDSSSSTCDTSDSSSTDDEDSCVSLTIGASGGDGGNGGDVSIHASNIYTAGFSANGVVAQSIAGGGGVGLSSGLAVSKVKITFGGTADGNSGYAGTVTVQTLADTQIVTKGDASQAIIAQSIGGGGGLAGVALGTETSVNDDTIKDVLSVTLGSDSEAGSAHGKAVVINHYGAIHTYGTRSAGIVAQSISGGGGFITADATVMDKISFVKKQAPNSANHAYVNLKGGASIVTSGDGAFGILAQTVSGGGGVAADLAQRLNAFYGYYNNSHAKGSDYYYSDHGTSESVGVTNVSLDADTTISTTGKYAHGIVAQSIGGSGGIFTRNGKTYAGTLGRFNNKEGGKADGNSQSGGVVVTVGGTVTVADPTAWGVWAQTTGETLTINVPDGGSISGSTAGGSDGDYTGGAIYTSAAHKTTVTINSFSNVTGNVVQHKFDSTSSAANGVAQTAALAGTAMFINQGTGTFVTGAIADIDAVVNAGTIDLGGEWNTVETRITGDLVGVGTSDLGSVYDAASLGLATDFSAFSYYSGNQERIWRSAKSSRGGLLAGLDVDMEKGTSDRLHVEGDFAGRWGVDVNANALLPNTRAEFLKVDGADLSDISVLSSTVFSFSDVTTSSDGWAGFSVASADFTGTGVTLGRNATSAAGALQQAWDRLADGRASEVQFADDKISLGEVFGAFHQSTPESFSDMLLTVASQTAAAPLADSPAAAISAANSVLSCPAFETSGVMTDEGSCVWARVTGGGSTQDNDGDLKGYQKSTSGFQAGGQVDIGDGWFLGTSLAYGNSWFRNDGGTQKLDQDSFTGAIALKKEIGPWLFGLVGGGGYNWGDSKRYINLDTLSATAKGSPDSAMFFARARASYEFAFSDAYYMRPKVDFDVINMQQFSYQETGAGALNLMVDGNSDTAFSVTPGIEFGARIAFLDDMPARLYADLGVSFLSTDEWETTARFAGLSSMDSFSTFTPIADTVGRVSLGLDLAKRQGMEVKLQYDGSFAKDYQSHIGSLRFGYRF